MIDLLIQHVREIGPVTFLGSFIMMLIGTWIIWGLLELRRERKRKQ